MQVINYQLVIITLMTIFNDNDVAQNNNIIITGDPAPHQRRVPG
jgi:hypothetical protein